MKRAFGLSLTLALLAGPAFAQGTTAAPMASTQWSTDRWITADSLVKALGITDAKVKDAIAPHLAEVDKILKTAADERMKGKSMTSATGMPVTDSAGKSAMMGKYQEWQTQLDTHLGAVRAALPEANRAAFDALQKPSVKGGWGRKST